MAALSNIPTMSRCRVDLYSGSATQILPLSGEGKGALCLGGSRAVCQSLKIPSPRALLPMAAKGLSQPRRGLRYLQAPASPQLLPQASAICLPTRCSPDPGYHSHQSATLHLPHWALFPGL